MDGIWLCSGRSDLEGGLAGSSVLLRPTHVLLLAMQQAAKVAPKDPDLRKKLAECEKEVKRLRFEEALAMPVGVLSACVGGCGGTALAVS